MDDQLQAPEHVQRTAIDLAMQFSPTLVEEIRLFNTVLALTDAGVRLAVRPWTSVADFGDVSSDVTQAVLAAFRANGVEMAVLPRALHLVERGAA